MQSEPERLRLLLLQLSLSYNIILCPDTLHTYFCEAVNVACVADDKSGVVQMIDKWL